MVSIGFLGAPDGRNDQIRCLPSQETVETQENTVSNAQNRNLKQDFEKPASSRDTAGNSSFKYYYYYFHK